MPPLLGPKPAGDAVQLGHVVVPSHRQAQLYSSNGGGISRLTEGNEAWMPPPPCIRLLPELAMGRSRCTSQLLGLAFSNLGLAFWNLLSARER